jgi:hypothetical protein
VRNRIDISKELEESKRRM